MIDREERPMIHKLTWPAAVLACLLLVAELFNLSAMQHFGAILSIAGIAFCLLARISARSRNDQRHAKIALGALVIYALVLVRWILLIL